MRQRQRIFLKEWREFRNLTQEELGNRVELTKTQVSRIERGLRPYTQDTLEAFAYALNTDVASLLMRNPLLPNNLWSLWDAAIKLTEAEQQAAVDALSKPALAKPAKGRKAS